MSGGYPAYEATFTVVQTLKGTCRPQEQLTVEVDLVHVRELPGMGPKPRDKPAEIALGRRCSS